jgi:hypothetical protein
MLIWGWVLVSARGEDVVMEFKISDIAVKTSISSERFPKIRGS